MIYCCISATYKIYSLSNEINTDEIAKFTEKNFNIDSRITVVNLLEYEIYLIINNIFLKLLFYY